MRSGRRAARYRTISARAASDAGACGAGGRAAVRMWWAPSVRGPAAHGRAGGSHDTARRPGRDAPPAAPESPGRHPGCARRPDVTLEGTGKGDSALERYLSINAKRTKVRHGKGARSDYGSVPRNLHRDHDTPPTSPRTPAALRALSSVSSSAPTATL